MEDDEYVCWIRFLKKRVWQFVFIGSLEGCYRHFQAKGYATDGQTISKVVMPVGRCPEGNDRN